MKRLVTFGCSFTYGMGLEDCYIPDDPWHICTGRPGPEPSMYAWPQLTANALKMDCVNLGQAGISNKTIAHKILTTEFKKSDTVAIMWTFFSRTSVIRESGIEEISVWRDERTSRVYYKVLHTDENSIFDNYEHINFCNFYLKDKVAKIVNVLAMKSITDLRESDFAAPHWNTVNLDLVMDEYHKFPLSQDGIHPGAEAHQAFSQRLLKNIKSKR